MAIIVGTAADETLNGTNGDDTINGGAGNDVLNGLDGNDSLYGDEGNDELNGGNGNDFLQGNLDNDTLNGGAGDDEIRGGLGIDTVTYATAAAGVTVDMSVGLLGEGVATGDGSDTIFGMENITGSNFADTLIGDDGDNAIDGLLGNDIIIGGLGNDMLTGGAGRDVVRGGFGDDFIHGGGGDDQLFGGDGMDFVSYIDSVNGISVDLDAGIVVGGAGTGTDTVDSFEVVIGSNHDDTFMGRAGVEEVFIGIDGVDTISHANSVADMWGNGVWIDLAGGSSYEYASGASDAFVSIENAVGSDHNDYIYGSDGDNILIGGAGNDSLEGNDGVDTVRGGAGDDYVWGGNGADSLFGGDGSDWLAYWGETSGVVVDIQNNFTVVASGNDTIQGFEHVEGTNYRDAIYGNQDANEIYTYDGNDKVSARGGDDEVYGGDGDDNLRGNNDNDTLYGEDGNDRLFGNRGDDTLVGGWGNDELSGAGGNDTAVFDTWSNVTVDLSNGIATGEGNDTLLGIENVTTADGNDTLIGDGVANILDAGSGDDTVLGGAGNDTLRGGWGSDVLSGGTGNDTLFGGGWSDTLSGGSGNDTFAFEAIWEPDGDVITDFQSGDVIDLSAIDADINNLLADDAFVFIGTGTFSNDEGELRYYQSGGNTFVEGDDDGDGLADFTLQLAGTHTLAAGDFVL